jgi:UDP-glucuronate 4-epimerase
MKQSNILVTGGAGFIGSHVTRELLKRGYNVFAVDSFSDYYSVELKKLRIIEFEKHPNYFFERVDISELSSVNSLFHNNRFDGVIHLAAQAGVRIPLGESHRYISSNITGFYNILSKSIETNVKNVVYASSSSVYGDASPLPYSENSSILDPKSFYGATKLNNEHTARILSQNYDLSTRGLRFFTVYGREGRPDMAYFRLMASALGKYEFTLHGDGTIERDFTFIDDVSRTTVELYEDLIKRKAGFYDVVNIGGNRALSMEYLISLIEDITGVHIKVSRSPSYNIDSRKTLADKSYLNSLIGLQAFTPLEHGLKDFYQWMKQPRIENRIAAWVRSTI